MKIVREDISDVLKPKSKEEIRPHEEFRSKRLKDILSNAKDEIDFLRDIKNVYSDQQWFDMREQIMQHIMEDYYSLPEYLQRKFSDEFWEVMGGFDELNESLNEQKKLNLSAGFVIIQNNKILLVHPTGSKWYGTYSIPKGHIEEGEDFLDAAIRETKEEIGISINSKDIKSGPHFIDYTDKKDKLYKRVYYYIVKPQIPITKDELKLQKSEIDWAGFLTKEDAEKRIFWRFKEILNNIKS